MPGCGRMGRLVGLPRLSSSQVHLLEAVPALKCCDIWRPGDASLGEAKQRKCTPAINKRPTGDAPFNQPLVAGVLPQWKVGTLK